MTTPCSGPGGELLVLAQNFVITVCNESLGYIHAVSLRWTLQKCGRLDFCSDLRLIQNAGGNGPNAWYSNTLVLVAITVAYGASALTLQTDSSLTSWGEECQYFCVCGIAWIILGCALAAQACIASWAMTNQSQWPTWSSDAMDIAAACVHKGYLRRHRRRALQGLSQCSEEPRPMLAVSGQVSAYRSHKQIRHITYALWVAVVLSLLYAIVLFAYSSTPQARQNKPYNSIRFSGKDCWSLVGGTRCALVILYFDVDYNGGYTAWCLAWLLLLLCALQAVTTLPLHFAELCMNCSVDETTWRQTSATRGQKRTSNAIVRLLSSWQLMILFCLKPFAHWIYSLSFALRIGQDVSFGPPQVLYVTLVLFVLAVLTTVMALWHHKGPQPSTFGHLQTLVDLIDEWPGKNDRLFWGDKGPLEGTAAEGGQEGLRHAGTHCQRLPPIEMTRLYA